MNFSDTTNKDGILQKCELYLFGSNYGSITGSTVRLAEFTGLSNDAMDNVSDILLNSDNTWQWDDTNNTDFPIATSDLVNGQKDYSFASTFLKIERVEALDSTGSYYPLYPIDTADFKQMNITETEYSTTNGLPIHYDKIGNSIFLYPQPDTTQVTATDGLKVRFQRAGSYFATTDTTKEPGFASIFHKLIPLYASLEYASANEMVNKVNMLTGKIEKAESRLEKFMGKRQKDSKPVISMKRKNAK